MNIGVWVDSQKAVVIRLTESGFESHSIPSGMEPHPAGTASADLLQYNDASILNAFYEKVVAAVRGSDSVLIFGPGEEKVELGVRIPGNSIGQHVAGIETMPAMTDEQIASRIRTHFGVPAP